VAQENVYDYFGRPSASILPAPYPEPSLTPYLHYIQNLNVNQVDSPYVYKNVLGSRPATCQLNPDSLSTDSGASRYYSANNFFIGQNPDSYYIPDAAGFPLSVTQYTNDNTGRIRAQGGVGKQFQPGKVSDPTQNQNTKYYYAKPDQWELDQLFANDVGYAEHYLKNMVVDPNGQISISYLNASGKTIATALTGQSPAMVDTLPSYTQGRATLSQLLKPSQFVYDATALTLTANATFLASVVGMDTMSFSMQQLIDYYPGTFKLCSNCYYLFSAQLTDDCGNVVDSIASTALGSAVGDSTATGPFQGSVVVPVNSIGEYNVTVKLAFDNNIIQAYADTFVNQAISHQYLQRQFDYLRRLYLDSLNLAGCYKDCHTCQTTLGTQGAFVAMLQTEFVGLGVDTTTSTDTTLSRWANTLYMQLKDSCNALQATCTYAGPCDATKSLMLDDVSPGGQYALFVDSTGTPLEPGANVITDSTGGTPNWRIAFPPEPATDSAYMANQFQLPDGTYTSPNAASFTVQQLVNNWNPNWANAFLQYHPEYCQLLFCENNAAYESWDQYVQNDITTAALVPKIPNGTDTLHYNYTNASDWLLPADPFFKSGGPGYVYQVQMDSDLVHFSERILNIPYSTAPNKGLMAFVDYKLYCQDTTGNMNLHIYPDSSWNCTPNDSCRVSNREWLLYQQFYFEAKQKYYNLLQSASCGSYCPVGQPVSSPLPGNCPVATDFSVQLNNDTTVTDSAGYQAIAIVHNPGSITQDSVRVSIYYPPNTAGLDTLVTFYGGDSQEIRYVPDSIPVSEIGVHQVYCGGLPTYGNDSTWVVHVSDVAGGTIPDYCAPRVVRSTILTLTNSAGTPVSAVNMVVAYIKYSYANCGTYIGTATFPLFIYPGQSTSDSLGYVSAVTCPCTETAEYTLSCIDSLVNASHVTGISTCTGYTYRNPQGPVPPGTCLTALSVKMPRFPNITYAAANPLDSITESSQLIDPTMTAIQTQGQDMCTGEATQWIAALQPGLDTIHASAGLIDTLRQALISICSAGVDLTHPVGASSLSPDTSGSYSSFGDAIQQILLGGGNFTTLINPWLIDSPNPYITPSNGSSTGAQVMTQTISNSNASICAVLSQLDSLAVDSGQTLYDYLTTTYGAAMTLDSLDLVTLQNSCTNCRFLLANNITLPVFLEPGAQGCVMPSDYATALKVLNKQFGRTLVPTDTNYMVIRTNFLNQYFGFGLSYDQYNDYDTLLTTNPAATLCNVPPYTTTNANPYDCVQNNISVAVANGLNDWNNYIAANRQAFIASYESTCSLAQPGVTRNSLEQLYHYTLYYYDQADNLVRTVPPEGVTLVDSSLFSFIDKARGNDTLAVSYNGPTTDATLSTALDTLSHVLSAPQGAVELWLYNNGSNNYHVVAATPDNKYIFQAGIAGDTLSVDVFPMSAPSAASVRLLPVTGHYIANIAALQPLNPFALLVFQGDTLGKGPNAPQLYLNGTLLTLLHTPLPTPLNFTATAGTSSVTLPDSIQTLKHMRLYRHLLDTATIHADAANAFFAASDTNYAGWFRFNVPAEGSQTTVNDTSTLETAYYDTFPNHALPTTYAYNGTNQVVQQLSPDGGTNRFWYDLLSRLVVSQNDKQNPLHNYSYTVYDTIGRIIEVGQKYQTTLSLATPHYLPADSVALFYAAGTNSQITDTYYDNPLDTVSGHTNGIASIYSQYNLRKRVAASTYTQTEGSPVLRASYYTYDIDGNVSSLWQQLDGLYQNSSNQGLKRIDYEYDLVSGKVNFVRYQDGQPDAFYYGYNYDADNRIVSAWSSPVALVDTLTGSYMPWPIAKQDAQYYYYLHGPLRRMELGTQGRLLQGLDYAYTLQGWLKGVNSADGDPNLDMGQDGAIPRLGGVNTAVAQDALAYSLGYYTGDYTPIGGSGSQAFALTYSQTMGDITGQSLYNGNISNTTLAVGVPSAPNPFAGNAVGYTYHYDQLNRLKKMRQYTGINGGSTWDRSYITLNDQENVTYDGNGNILTYGRNGGDTTAQTIDSLTYNYNYTGGKLLNNQLQYIHDAVTSSGYDLDLRNQTNTNNYQYDGIGNITKDIQSGITNIAWTVYNKPDTIYKSAGNITYNYNTANQRISKTYNGLTTWYVRDAQGNVLSVYDNADTTVNWREQHLYGSSRIGMWKPNMNLADSNAVDIWDTTGYRLFELNNHLGNVMTTINDVRNPYFKPSHIGPLPGPLQYFTANVLSSQDYYPFGMLMPDRQYTNGDSTYRYGFNGKENDNEVKGTGNQQDYGMRIYDPRVGRFLSVDPLTQKYAELTPYQFASNTPIQAIDLDGLEATSTVQNNVYFVQLKNADVHFVMRQSQQSFVQAAAANNSKLVDFTVNTQQFETTSMSAAYNYRFNTSTPHPTSDYQTQGYNVIGGKNISGRSSPQTFYFSQSSDGSWAAGKGDVPKGSSMGFGGGIPVYVNGLKYGDQNIYKSGAPPGLPSSGDPGATNTKYLDQRSNSGYALQNGASVGKTVIGYNSNTKIWTLVVQPDGVSGMTLDAIRNKLINQGNTSILSFDGSSSSTLVKDGKALVTPAEYKNNAIPTGATFTVPPK
jgi:RHS repeat-associated protein